MNNEKKNYYRVTCQKDCSSIIRNFLTVEQTERYADEMKENGYWVSISYCYDMPYYPSELRRE